MIHFKFVILTIYLFFLYLFNVLLVFPIISLINLVFPKTGFMLKNSFTSSLSFFIKYFMKTNIYVNDNNLFKELSNNKNKILISNHISELDFLFNSFIVNNFGNYYNNTFIATSKKMIGYFLLGPSILSVLSKDIYLNRNIGKDTEILSSNNNATLLLIYPEGTCFSKNKKLQSDNYVNKNNLYLFKYHVYPRITGLQTIITNNDYDFIYDITIIYNTIPKEKYGEEYTFYKYLYNYVFPQQVFLHIKKYEIDNRKFVTDDKYVEKLLVKIYKNKDKIISSFDVNNNKFVNIDYNFYSGLINSVLFGLLSILSVYLFYQYAFIKILYLMQIVFYFIYFRFIY